MADDERQIIKRCAAGLPPGPGDSDIAVHDIISGWAVHASLRHTRYVSYCQFFFFKYNARVMTPLLFASLTFAVRRVKPLCRNCRPVILKRNQIARVVDVCDAIPGCVIL
jgi:hypothetical protein